MSSYSQAFIVGLEIFRLLANHQGQYWYQGYESHFWFELKRCKVFIQDFLCAIWNVSHGRNYHSITIFVWRHTLRNIVDKRKVNVFYLIAFSRSIQCDVSSPMFNPFSYNFLCDSDWLNGLIQSDRINDREFRACWLIRRGISMEFWNRK